MSETLHTLIQEHHAFYEVSPYYIAATHANGSSPLATRSVHAGFDVDVYGESPMNGWVIPGPDPDYRIAYSELQKVAETLSRRVTDSCSLEVIEFPATIYFDRQGKPEALLRIRISHFRGLNEPAGLPEQRAREELEKELKSLGIPRR